jgi:hypothetical protein
VLDRISQRQPRAFFWDSKATEISVSQAFPTKLKADAFTGKMPSSMQHFHVACLEGIRSGHQAWLALDAGSGTSCQGSTVPLQSTRQLAELVVFPPRNFIGAIRMSTA